MVTRPAEYVITLRVRTTREPRDDPWPQLRTASEALFKVRPGGDLDLIGATVELVPSVQDRA